MNKEAIFKPQFEFIGKTKDFDRIIRKNIDQMAEMCGWGQIKTVSKRTLLHRIYKINVYSIAILHTNNTSTYLIYQVNKTSFKNEDFFGFIHSSVKMAIDALISIEQYNGHPGEVVVVSDVIDPDLIKCINKYHVPISFLMIDGDRCVYHKHLSDSYL